MNDFGGGGGVGKGEKTMHGAMVPTLRTTGGGGRHRCVQGLGKSPWTQAMPVNQLDRVSRQTWHSFSHVYRQCCEAYNRNLLKRRNYIHSSFLSSSQ